MSCRRVSGLLSAYLDRELTGAEMLAVEDHLYACSCCREEYEGLRETKRLVASLAFRASRTELDSLLQPDSRATAGAFPASVPLVRPKPIAAAALLTIAGVWLATSALDGPNVPAGSPVMANGDVVALEQPSAVLVAPAGPAMMRVSTIAGNPAGPQTVSVSWTSVSAGGGAPVIVSQSCVGPSAFCGIAPAAPAVTVTSAALGGVFPAGGSGGAILIHQAVHRFMSGQVTRPISGTTIVP